MKRLPLALTLLALLALAASIAYWVLQLYRPPQRPLAAPPIAAAPEPPIDAAATLFGGQAASVATNFHLTGVVAAGADSVAILYADGSPPQALTIGKEVAPGVTVSEVHARYVMLSDGGVMKRIDLPFEIKSTGAPSGPVGNAPAGEPQTSPGALRTQGEPPEAGRGEVGTHDEPPQAPAPAPVPQQPAPNAMQAQAPQPVPPAQPPAAPPSQAQPAVTPQQLRQAAQQPVQAQPVQAPAVQMPAPTRSPGSPVSQPTSTR